jgi:phosphoenolpyruvate synthase/pyruvate phosphate dikinase
MSNEDTPDIRWLGSADCDDEAQVGGKAASLSRLAMTYPVPAGFAIAALPTATVVDVTLSTAIIEAYELLAGEARNPELPVAVRSSAVDEDGVVSSFAGQHATFLNIRGGAAVVEAVQACLRSGESGVAASYREARGLETDDVQMAVLVQRLVAADTAAVAFSANPVTGDRGEVMINSNWGLGESIVGGLMTPDIFVLRKDTLAVTMREVGAKERFTVRTDAGTEEVDQTLERQAALSLTDEQAVEIARLAISLEQHTGSPVDVECAFLDGTLFLLQCRPITTLG